MAGEFVAGGEIGEALHVAAAFGGFAQGADQALGGTALAGHAGAHHGEDHRAHGRRDLHFQREGRRLRRAGVEDGLERAALVGRDAIDKGLGTAAITERQDIDGAIPGNGARGDVPIEDGASRRLQRHAQARAVLDRAQTGEFLRLLMKRRGKHGHHPRLVSPAPWRHYRRPRLKKGVTEAVAPNRPQACLAKPYEPDWRTFPSLQWRCAEPCAARPRPAKAQPRQRLAAEFRRRNTASAGFS